MGMGFDQHVTVFLLVGPKGAGKTTVLKRMYERNPSRVAYIPSESLFLKARDAHAAAADDAAATENIYAENGASWVDAAYDLISEAIAAAAADGRELVVCESTGTPPQFAAFVRRATAAYDDVYLAHMSAPLETCAARIAQRDSAGHLPAARELVDSVHAASAALLTAPDSGLPPFYLALNSEHLDADACADACYERLAGIYAGRI